MAALALSSSRTRIAPGQAGDGLILLLFAEHFLFGANGAVFGLAAAWLHSLVLLALLSQSWFRNALRDEGASWLGPGALFLGVLAFALAATGGWLAPEALPKGGRWSGSVNAEATFVEVVKLAGLGCVFLAAFGIGRAEGGWKRLLDTLVICGAAFAAYALLANAMAPSRLLWTTKYTAVGRLTGNFVSANTAAALLGMLIVCEVSRLSILLERTPGFAVVDKFRREPNGLALHIGALVLFSGCLLLTASRTGIAVTAACVLLTLAGRQGVPWRWVLGGMAAAFVVAGGLALRRYGLLAAEFADRTQIITLHASAGVTRPLTGFGLGTFHEVNRTLVQEGNFSALQTLGAAHNVFVQWLQQAGVMGSALMFGTIGWLLAGLAHAGRRRGFRTDARVVLACSLLLLLQGLFDYALEVPSVAATWAMLLGGASGRAARIKAGSRTDTELTRSPGN